MQPDDLLEARAWPASANEDLALSQQLVGNRAFPRQASYGAQQAAEKALKALLTALAIPFPKQNP